jgi:hypothetical protein
MFHRSRRWTEVKKNLAKLKVIRRLEWTVLKPPLSLVVKILDTSNGPLNISLENY